jgi:hypothetical protein
VLLACWGYFIDEQGQRTALKVVARRAGWIDIVDLRARPPLIVSRALHGLDGEEVEAHSTSRAIPDVGSEWTL